MTKIISFIFLSALVYCLAQGVPVARENSEEVDNVELLQPKEIDIDRVTTIKKILTKIDPETGKRVDFEEKKIVGRGFSIKKIVLPEESQQLEQQQEDKTKVEQKREVEEGEEEETTTTSTDEATTTEEETTSTTEETEKRESDMSESNKSVEKTTEDNKVDEKRGIKENTTTVANTTEIIAESSTSTTTTEASTTTTVVVPVSTTVAVETKTTTVEEETTTTTILPETTTKVVIHETTTVEETTTTPVMKTTTEVKTTTTPVMETTTEVKTTTTPIMETTTEVKTTTTPVMETTTTVAQVVEDIVETTTAILNVVHEEIVDDILNRTQFPTNPCDSKNFNYFQSHPTDAHKYVQCDPWGTGTVKKCNEGMIWNMWSLKCDMPENVRNMTSLSLPVKVFNCSLSGSECLNEGVCTESETGGASSKCVCKPEFTGQFCDSRIDSSDLTQEIMNGTFSLAAFRQSLTSMNITSDPEQYTRYKDQLDSVTYTELMNYIGLYKGEGEIRYDTLLNNLIESILENIYPDAAFLSTFNPSSTNVLDVLRIITNLMSYSKYSVERYQDVFSKYQGVLTSLVKTLKTKEPRLRDESIMYTRLTSIFMNKTIAMTMAANESTITNSESVNSLLETQQSNHNQLNEIQVRERLGNQYNATLEAAETLFGMLEKFQTSVVELMKSKSSEMVSQMTLSECKIEGTQEIRILLNSISSASAQIWDSLVNYGFWFITSCLSKPVV